MNGSARIEDFGEVGFCKKSEVVIFRSVDAVLIPNHLRVSGVHRMPSNRNFNCAGDLSMFENWCQNLV